MIVVPREKIAAQRALGFWNDVTVDDLFRSAVTRAGQREAVVDPGNKEALLGLPSRRLTFAQLAHAVARCARALDDAGIRRDDILLVQLPNCVEQVVLFLACMRRGIAITPVPVQYREHELTHIFSVTRPAAVVTGTVACGHPHAQMFLDLAKATRRKLDVFALGASAPPGATLATAWFDDGDFQETAGPDKKKPGADDVVTICWTSGTEGIPKGVPRNHNEWRVIAELVRGSVQMQEGIRLLNPFPLTNMGGIGGLFFPWLLTAGTLVQHHPFALPVFLGQLKNERIDYTVAPPAVLDALLKDWLANKDQPTALLRDIDFARLRSIGSGSAPLSEWMVRGYKEAFGVDIINYFGSNEGTCLLSAPVDVKEAGDRATLFPRLGVARYAWSQPVSKMIETRIVDPLSGLEIEEPDVPGELRIKGAPIFSGYFNDPVLTQTAFDAQGFFRTGDLFAIAGAKGELYRFVGRLKDVVIRGGVNVSSEELETLLLAHPSVSECAIIAVPDERLGERVCAIVVARAGTQTPTLEGLAAYLRDERKVAVFKLPERLELVDVLPRNPVGKVLKTALRARFGRSLPAPPSG